MAWHRPGDRPLFEPMMIILLTHICVTRPQWYASVNCVSIGSGNGLSSVGAKPLAEPMLPSCQLDPWKQTLVKFESKYFSFMKMNLKVSSDEWWSFARGDVLSVTRAIIPETTILEPYLEVKSLELLWRSGTGRLKSTGARSPDGLQWFHMLVGPQDISPSNEHRVDTP